MKTEADISFARLSIEHLDQLMQIEEISFSRPWSRESYAHELSENQFAYYYGCFHQGELVAFAGFWFVIDEGHVANIAVLPEWRGKHIGELLMRQLIAVCSGLGGKRMTLEVRESNTAAVSLYEKLGFKQQGLRKDYYDLPTENAVIMWLHMDRPE